MRCNLRQWLPFMLRIFCDTCRSNVHWSFPNGNLKVSRRPQYVISKTRNMFLPVFYIRQSFPWKFSLHELEWFIYRHNTESQIWISYNRHVFGIYYVGNVNEISNFISHQNMKFHPSPRGHSVSLPCNHIVYYVQISSTSCGWGNMESFICNLSRLKYPVTSCPI